MRNLNGTITLPTKIMMSVPKMDWQPDFPKYLPSKRVRTVMVLLGRISEKTIKGTANKAPKST